MAGECLLTTDGELAPGTPGHQELVAAGYTVLGVADTWQLLELLRRGEGDVLIFNVDVLPQDELPFLRYLQTQRPSLSIIAASANESLQWETAVRQQGIFYYLPKPIDLMELRLVLADAMGPRAGTHSREPFVP